VAAKGAQQCESEQGPRPQHPAQRPATTRNTPQARRQQQRLRAALEECRGRRCWTTVGVSVCSLCVGWLAGCSGAPRTRGGWTRPLQDVARDLRLGVLSTHRASFRPRDLACLGVVRAVTQRCLGVSPLPRSAEARVTPHLLQKCNPCRVCRLTRAGDLLAHSCSRGACTWPLETFLGSDNSGRSAVCQECDRDACADAMPLSAMTRPGTRLGSPLSPAAARTSTRHFGRFFPNQSHVKRYGWRNERHIGAREKPEGRCSARHKREEKDMSNLPGRMPRTISLFSVNTWISSQGVNADSTIGENPQYPPRMIRHVSETPHSKRFKNVSLVARLERVVDGMRFLLILMPADLPFLTLQFTVCDLISWPRQG
jgi:hypothetical protein